MEFDIVFSDPNEDENEDVAPLAMRNNNNNNNNKGNDDDNNNNNTNGARKRAADGQNEASSDSVEKKMKTDIKRSGSEHKAVENNNKTSTLLASIIYGVSSFLIFLVFLIFLIFFLIIRRKVFLEMLCRRSIHL